jgi:pyruvyltransferase
MAVGSIIDRGVCDVMVWGSGVLNVHSVRVVIAQSGIRDFDVRAVRGPRTMEALTKAGFECPRIFGDPAILLPLMYPVKPANIRYRVGLILHHATSIDSNVCATYGLRQISTVKNDYKAFVNKIVECKAVISSSLHGIIIAESYGIPAIYLWEDSAVGSQGIKFADWYESTGRTNVIAARTIEEALDSEAPVIPDLEDMRASLLGAFPYDLWVS